MKRHTEMPPGHHFDVIIAGAGPVGLFLACELGLAGVSVLVLERGACALEEASAGGGKLHTAPRCHEELDADLLLELRDLPAQRRLRDVKLLGGPSEVLRLRNSDKVAQVT